MNDLRKTSQILTHSYFSLDYEFMTDFFLTYRSFISPTQLCRLFILRFRWALENDNEDRKIVRIR